jgi:hypothetical protein
LVPDFEFKGGVVSEDWGAIENVLVQNRGDAWLIRRPQIGLGLSERESHAPNIRARVACVSVQADFSQVGGAAGLEVYMEDSHRGGANK